MFETPVLFLLFNRPDTTTRVFAQIKKVKPKYLFVAADGPRKAKPAEENLCREAREIVMKGIDWDCELKILFRDQNIGCGLAVSEAITWFFENVEEGIILEDDTLPDVSFFYYCEKQLIRYKNVPEVIIISGNNFQNNIIRGDGSYYFTKYIHIWGWATWRDRWEGYDFTMRAWPERNILEWKALFKNDKEYDYWTNIFDLLSEQRIDTWDYQLSFLSYKNKGINVVPNKNLVKNIGFGKASTHTNDPRHKLANLKINSYKEDINPSQIANDELADIYTYNFVFCNEVDIKKSNKALPYRLLRKLLKGTTNVLKSVRKNSHERK